MSTPPLFFALHQSLLESACEAIVSRTHWSPYAEIPSATLYGERAKADGEAAYRGVLGQPFLLEGPDVSGVACTEVSPYTGSLGIEYATYAVDDLVATSKAALPTWRDAGTKVRTGVCLEILARLNKHSFAIANATMHTTGQGFAMAFQAGGPHAQDRGLEAVATAWLATSVIPEQSLWCKPQSRRVPLAIRKHYHIVPRGIALVVACSTFPTWNTYPGLFASLATGNPVIIKPHTQAVLPVAMTVRICQQVLAEAGFDPRLVMMAAEDNDTGIAKALATHAEVRLIDYTGGNFFGDWLSANATQATLYKEQAGVNAILLDSVDDMAAVAKNLAFSVSLYSGQMCTTPQALCIPRDGINTAQGWLSFDEVTQQLCSAINTLLSDPEQAAGVLGAIANPAIAQRLEHLAASQSVLLGSKTQPIPGCDNAVYRTPLVLLADVQDHIWRQEHFGPVVFIVAIDSTEQGLAVIAQTIAIKGALTLGVYSTDEAVLDNAENVAIEQGVALSCNLDGGIFINQSAAFSDFHATGNNPAANAALIDPAFVASRFAVVQSRRPAVDAH